MMAQVERVLVASKFLRHSKHAFTNWTCSKLDLNLSMTFCKPVWVSVSQIVAAKVNAKLFRLLRGRKQLFDEHGESDLALSLPPAFNLGVGNRAI